ncbi:hypothetical protein ACSAZL_13785 [Methanosarcina sp. T3]|uniref:hypothetical protein n=1 Tax=Methanosarcina sp. T3 TaxID=3439062 RepID=UPI003F82D2D6
MVPITRAGEKLKDSAEHPETTAIKSLEEKGSDILTEIEGYDEKFRELLHGFDPLLTGKRLVLSGLIK